MLLPLKPICSRREIRRDGTSIIYIQYCFSSKHRTDLNTGWSGDEYLILADIGGVLGSPVYLSIEDQRLIFLYTMKVYPSCRLMIWRPIKG
jgi:hypothetical protein